MAASMAWALRRIKKDPLGVINRVVVERLCRECGYVGWRNRELDPTTTLALCVQQIVHGNTPCSEVRHLAGRSFNASAWCQARARLPLGVYQGMLNCVCDAALPMTRQRDHLWHGHRTFLVDGSTFSMPKAPVAWMSKEDFDALPESLIVREIRRTARLPDGRRITVTIVTTLLNPRRYPADDLIALRLRRWDVETDIFHLKTTMGMDVLHCKTELGVRKELAVFCLVYNLVRVVMLEAAARQKVKVNRISFADALKWMRHARPGDRMPELIVNPWRPHRIEPRCRKRRPKQYDLMNKPRRVLRKTLKKRARNV